VPSVLGICFQQAGLIREGELLAVYAALLKQDTGSSSTSSSSSCNRQEDHTIHVAMHRSNLQKHAQFVPLLIRCLAIDCSGVPPLLLELVMMSVRCCWLAPIVHAEKLFRRSKSTVCLRSVQAQVVVAANAAASCSNGQLHTV